MGLPHSKLIIPELRVLILIRVPIVPAGVKNKKYAMVFAFSFAPLVSLVVEVLPDFLSFVCSVVISKME